MARFNVWGEYVDAWNEWETDLEPGTEKFLKEATKFAYESCQVVDMEPEIHHECDCPPILYWPIYHKSKRLEGSNPIYLALEKDALDQWEKRKKEQDANRERAMYERLKEKFEDDVD